MTINLTRFAGTFLSPCKRYHDGTPARYALVLIGCCWLNSAFAQPLSADQIAMNVYKLTHGLTHKNAISERSGKDIAYLLNYSPGHNIQRFAFESYVNNAIDDNKVQSRMMAIFRSGKQKGTGFLMTHYHQRDKQPLLKVWLPSLRKIRRFAAPALEDRWNGSVFTFGEIFLRRPDDDQHTLERTGNIDGCFEFRDSAFDLQPSCANKDRPVYILRSRTRKTSWWYDYYLSWIDATSFAPHKAEYFKDGKLIKQVVVDWRQLEQTDKSSLYPAITYGREISSGRESLVVVPESTVKFDTDIKAGFWSEKTLRKIKR